MNLKIIGIRDNTEYLETGIDYFSTKWKIDRKIYADSISNSITTENPLPRWYLLLKENEIIGSYGLITNDFISRQDLYPWLCALYIEEKERGKRFGKMLLEHGRQQAAMLGFKKLYLSTDHIGYYEKYKWKFIATGYHPWGEESRIYEIETDLNKD
jgi:GNAT superfamily N-acetyltransferase